MRYFFILLLFISKASLANCTAFTSQQLANSLNAAPLAQWMTIEVANCHDVFMQEQALGFRLHAETQKVHQGIRAEVAIDYPYKVGDKVIYAFEMMLPQDFKADKSKNRWWLLAQWHDQPDPRWQESWVNFPKRSPPVSIFIEEKNGKTGIGLEVLHPKQKAWFPVTLGEWLSLHVQIDWHQDASGSVEFDVDDHPEMHREILGVNMHNAYQHYFKLGQYRHPDIKTDNTVFFRNVKIYHAD